MVDCPRCGRTLRVPGADGKIRPLPAERINVNGDSALQSALSELSALQSVAVAQPPDLPADDTPGDPRAAEDTIAGPADRSPSVAPVSVSPASASESASVATAEADGTAGPASPPPAVRDQTATTAASADSLHAPLQELAALGATAQDRLSSRSKSTESRPRTLNQKLLLLAVGVLLFGNGFFLGRGLFGGASDADSGTDAATRPAAAHLAAANSNDALPQADRTDAVTLHGRVTYVDATSERQPDEGALLLLLPDTREGSLKFDGGLLWLAEHASDRRAVRAALRELGAGVTVADSNGQFVVTGAADSLRLVAISRHASRGNDVSPSPAVTDLLRQWFDSVPHLVGQLATEEVPVGESNSDIDVQFR